MMDTILFYTLYTLLLMFGILLSVAFAGVRLSKGNALIISVLFALCGIIQATAYALFNEMLVWKIYPLIGHMPVILLLCLYFRLRISTSLAAVVTTYLCCQPAKWFGIFMETLTDNQRAGQITHIITLLLTGAVIIWHLAPCISEIYRKDNRSIFIFSIVPMVYYIFDYSMGVYTGFFTDNNRIVVEFLPFFLCIAYLMFCVVYYKEYEKKTDAERKEQIIRITAEQQAKESETLRRGEHEIRCMHNDVLMFLSRLSLYLQREETKAAQKIIKDFKAYMEASSIKRYCENAMVNYILTEYGAKCRDEHIDFQASLDIADLTVDEVMFTSILSNALDNAMYAQMELPKGKRSIKVMLKISDSKLLLSVRNPFRKKPLFADGMPVSDKSGHGYGTQSIRYITEHLGGNCQFTIENETFVLRVVL